MPVDPAIRGMLALLEAMQRPTLDAGTHEEARRAFRMLTVDMRPADATVAVGAVEETEVSGATGSLRARIYRPGSRGRAADDRVLPRRRLCARRPRHARQPVLHPLPRRGGGRAERGLPARSGGALPRSRGGLLRGHALGRTSTSRSSAGTRSASPWRATAPAATSPRWWRRWPVTRAAPRWRPSSSSIRARTSPWSTRRRPRTGRATS